MSLAIYANGGLALWNVSFTFTAGKRTRDSVLYERLRVTVYTYSTWAYGTRLRMARACE